MSCTSLFWELAVHNILKISGLSTPDVINIVAHYNKLILPDSNAELKARGYTAEQIATVKAVGKAPEVTSCGLKFTRHLREFDYPLFGYAWSLFENYEKGLLPFEGSVADQPAQVMDLFALLRNLKVEQERAAMQKETERNVRNQRQNKNRTGGHGGSKGPR